MAVDAAPTSADGAAADATAARDKALDLSTDIHCFDG
jgi:hypothetical protein